MKQFLITAAGVFAGLMIFLIGAPLLLVSMALSAAGPAPVPARSVLELDLRESLTDQSPQNPFAGFGRSSTSVMSVIEALRRAHGDERVRGLLVRLPESGLEPGMADELRLAIKHFRTSGKPVIAHSQGLYPAGVITSTYMVGASAGELWMQPGASLQVTGLATEEIFFKRFFDKYGISPQYEQRQEYKNAVNPFLYSDFTPAHREAQLSWMGSVYATSLAGAAGDRKTSPDALRTALEGGPYLAEDALRLKLIDKLGQVRQARRQLLDAAGDGAEIVEFHDYAQGDPDRARRGVASVAVIEAEGAIITGRDLGGNPFTGGSTIYSDELANAIDSATRNDDIKAIVLRINSPGGSDTASEQISDAIRQAKTAGKPVVASIGTYGASGGYWIASEATHIVAQPSTLTGSIGVYGGKFAVGEALARFGIDLRPAVVGSPDAGAYGVGQEFTAAQRAAFSRWMDRIYARFIARVAEGRKLPIARVQEIAKGRVWTGAQAKDLGLVDELGGFYQAVARARALANLAPDAPLRRMSPNDGPWEALQKALGVQAASARTLAAAAWVFADPRAEAVIESLAQARLRERGAAVLAPTPLP